MPSKPISEGQPLEPTEAPPPAPVADPAASVESTGLLSKLTEFAQRLASFGLGEAPDPLLTETRPPGKRRSQS